MPPLEMADGQPLTWLLCVAAAVEIRLLEAVIMRGLFFFFFSFETDLLYFLFRNLTRACL